MSMFVNLTGDARKDKSILANLKRALGEKVYEELHEDALRLGAVMFSTFAIHGNKLDKRDWDKLEPTEQLRWGAIAQKLLILLQDACTPCKGHAVEDDGSVNIRIPGFLVETFKATVPAVIASMVGGQSVQKPVPANRPDFVDMPFPPFAAPNFGSEQGNLKDVIDEAVKEVLNEEK